MNLLIDSGNSFIKWVLANDESSIIESSCSSKEVLSLHNIWKSYDAPARVIVSNVAGESIASEIKKVVNTLWHLDAEFLVSSQSCCGLTNSYHKPEQLGIDRWMAMVAAYHMSQSPVIVIDCGTAITIDLVNEKGFFLGGVIMPGINTAFQSLSADTDAVEDIKDTVAVVSVTTQSTEAAVQAGVLFGLAGGIEKVVKEQVFMIETEACIYITGGDAARVTPLLKTSTILQVDLVLQGLRVFADESSTG
jgi:type III pantothenate kinase